MDKETKKKIEEKLIETNKGNWFVRHIQKHLDNDEEGNCSNSIPYKVVGCTICGKTVYEIARETIVEIKEELKTKQFH